ncbi:MAG: hypothetical protein U5L96_18115 [Owenweeksia sp.]|nr:hypothetical protein [Owenweeksia sp.]
MEINNGPYPNMLISPPFGDFSNGLNQVRFKLAYEVAASSSLSDSLFLGFLTDPNDFSTFKEIQYLNLKVPTDQFQEFTIRLKDTNMVGNAKHLVFFYKNVGTALEFYLDDFHYEPVPCSPPSGFIASDSLCSGVELTWNSKSGNSFIEYGPVGFKRGQGTTTGIVQSPRIITG